MNTNSLYTKTVRIASSFIVLLVLFSLAMPVHAQVSYYNYSPRTQEETIAYLHGVIAQLLAQIAAQRGVTYQGDGRVLGVTYTSPQYQYQYQHRYAQESEIEVGTGFLRTEDDHVYFNGIMDLNDAPYAYAWFEYDTDDDDFDERTERIRVTRDGMFTIKVDKDEFRESTWYNYRAAGESPSGDRDYGTVRSLFVTDNGSGSSDDDEPDVQTLSARDIDDDSAELRGEVDMNDFRNGVVFFVYGEDEDQIEDVERDFDTYSDVDEDGDDLQKFRVDTDLDTSATYTGDVFGLDDNTDYFFQICVEYEDEDDDETLSCGGMEEFETD